MQSKEPELLLQEWLMNYVKKMPSFTGEIQTGHNEMYHTAQVGPY